MAQTPEQKVYSALRSLFTRTLPKGRWMLQRIETSTGTGIPDCYMSFMNNQFWIETKTLEYKVSNEQLNWASAHWLTGGLTFVVTRINGQVLPVKHAQPTRPTMPSVSSNILAHATPYPTLLELQFGGLTQFNLSTTQIRKGQEQLVFLAFDERMRDCSTLGVYIRRFNPPMLPVAEWVQRKEDRQL